MVKLQYAVTVLRDEYLKDDQEDREKVFWFSKHELTRDQERTLYYLHQKSVEINHVNNLAFASAEHLGRVIEEFSAEGTVYLVAPIWMIDQVKAEYPQTTFRTFSGYLADGVYEFLSVQQIGGGSQRSIFSRERLRELEIRDKIADLNN